MYCASQVGTWSHRGTRRRTPWRWRSRPPRKLPLLDAGTYYLSVTLEPAGTPIGDVKRHPISIVALKVIAPPEGEGEDALAEPGA